MPAALVLLGRRIERVQLPCAGAARARVVEARGRGQPGDPARGVRWLRRDRATGGARGAGVCAELRPARRHPAARERQSPDRVRGGLARDGPGLGDPVQPDRRRPQPPDHDAGADDEYRPLPDSRSPKTRPSTRSPDPGASRRLPASCQTFEPPLNHSAGDLRSEQEAACSS